MNIDRIDAAVFGFLAGCALVEFDVKDWREGVYSLGLLAFCVLLHMASVRIKRKKAQL